MSEEKLFEIFFNSLEFDINEYLVEELSNLQKEIVDDATFILKENIIGDIKSFGGSIKQNEVKFEELMKKAEEQLENAKYKEIKKKLKDYLKKLKELILKTCVVVIPVKELPWSELVFRTLPRIIYEDNSLKLLDNAIAYYGEIKCFMGRTTVYGKIKGQKPLFAPFTGNLELEGYKIDATEKGPKSQIFPYVNAIINSMDSVLISSQLFKYHENFQRHGDPICDFLMDDDELLESMENLNSGLESGRIKSEIAICSLALPLPSDNTTLVIVTDEGEDKSKYTRCFEAFLKYSAACCRAPSIKKEVTSQPSGVISTPGGQELKAWTAEELVKEAQKRMTTQPNMAAWTEEELAKLAAERGSGIPEGMEVWTEDELKTLAEKRRGGGLNIPEWTPDEEMVDCSNCGYSLRPGWTKCPICETPVEIKTSEKLEKEPSKEELSEEFEQEPPKENSESLDEKLDENIKDSD